MEPLGRHRVLFAIGGLARGGSETQFTRLLENLPQPVTDAAVVLHDDSQGYYLANIRALGIPVYGVRHIGRLWRPLRVLGKVVFMLSVVVRFRPDVIYAWLDESALYLSPIGRLLGIPVVVARRNISGSRMEQHSALVGRVQRGAERRASLVTANSQAVAAVAAQRGIARDRVRLVVNGHDAEPPLPMPDGEELVIGYLANFRVGKGHATMIQAAARLASVPGWRLVLAGGGPLADEVAALARAHGIADRVTITVSTDARAFWAQTHIAALLSEHEGSPNALIEAAFAGRPILATAVGGTPEVVGPAAGRLIAPDDAPAAAEAMRELLALDREALAAMGLRAHAHAAATFTIGAMVDGHVAALREALDGR